MTVYKDSNEKMRTFCPICQEWCREDCALFAFGPKDEAPTGEAFTWCQLSRRDGATILLHSDCADYKGARPWNSTN